MKMIKTLSSTAVVALFFFVSPTFADEQKNNFESGELQSIRNISQSILKIRGQQRQKILVETQPLRDEIQQVQEALNQAAVVNQPALVINQSNYSVTATSLKKPSSIERVSLWWRSMFKNNIASSKKTSPQAIKAESMKIEQLSKAKAILEKRKQKIDKNMPSFWQFGQSADPKQVRIRQALVSLEADIVQAGKAKGLARKEKLQAIIAKLDTKKIAKVTEQPNEPIPTITSITKHYRK